VDNPHDCAQRHSDAEDHHRRDQRSQVDARDEEAHEQEGQHGDGDAQRNPELPLRLRSPPAKMMTARQVGTYWAKSVMMVRSASDLKPRTTTAMAAAPMNSPIAGRCVPRSPVLRPSTPGRTPSSEREATSCGPTSALPEQNPSIETTAVIRRTQAAGPPPMARAVSTREASSCLRVGSTPVATVWMRA